MNKAYSAGLLALLPLFALVPRAADRPIEAGVALRMDLDELVQRSGLVVAGRVVAARALEGPRGRIDTEYTLTVDRTFWGEDVGQRVVRMPGGVLPSGRGLMLPGMATLSVGEEVVLLLTDEGDDGLRVPVGLAQGKFRVVRGEGGSRVAVRSQAGLELLKPRTGEVSPAEERELYDYADLAARIETAVARKRAEATRQRSQEDGKRGR